MICRTISITLSILFFAAFHAASLRGKTSPNVLFLICDDLNCDLGCYGDSSVESPNIDALAARGVRFRNAHCQFSLCGPSRASMMTGLYPDQTLIRRNAVYLREHLPNVTSMSQHFRQHGYFATRIGKIYHYNVPKNIGTSGHDDPHSWNHTINPYGRDKREEHKIFSLIPGSFGGTLSWLAADGTDDEQTDGMIAAEAIKRLQSHQPGDDPFFLAVGLFRPHTPYVAPKPYFEKYPVDQIEVPKTPEGYLETIPPVSRKRIRARKTQRNLSDEVAREVIQAYHASITFADAQVGRILNALEETGLSDETIVVFTSDHGYHMGEHGHWQKRTLFDQGTRVPLIFAGPGIHRGGEANLAEMVDIYPTLSRLAGFTTPEFVSGVSQVDTLIDPALATRKEALTQLDSDNFSIRTDRYRITHWGREGKDGREFYDHEDDPAELKNRILDESYAGVIADLETRLRNRVAASKVPPKGLQQNQFDNQRRVNQP